MLSDEEKQAIKDLIDSNNLSLIGDGTCINSRRTIGTILNLIEKQSKEIEELKEERLTLFDTTVKNSIKINDKKWEDKIKAKIEEIDFMIKEINQGHLQKYTVGELLGAKRFLQSLLEKE